MEQIPMDKLARVYLKIRARIQQLTQQYESEVEELKAQQDEIKTALKDQLMALGSKSVRTDQGTVILATKTRYFTQDWDSFKQFVTEHDALDVFERRIHQSNMAKFLEENPSLVPPGLNSDKEYDVSVRKPTK
jgi:sugar-specific transcriptional regulator TrmB